MAYPAKYKKAKKKAVAKKKATVKRKRNPVKKKRTAKQIAATKRLVALNKKRRKNPTKKKVTVKRKATKKRVARKKNPAKRSLRKWRVLCVVPSAAGLNKGLDPNKTGYWTGTGWDTNKSKAVRYPNVEAARNEAAHLPKKYRSGVYWSYATETV